MRLDSFLPPWGLSRAVDSRDSLDRLQQMKHECPDAPFAALASWGDVRRWLDKGGIWREATDSVLRPVLAAYKQNPNQTWQDILLFLFWRSLARVQWILRRLEPEPACRFSQVSWAFLHALARLDLNQRSSRLGAKLIQDARHDAWLYFVREDARGRKHKPLADEIDQSDTEGVGGVSLGGAEDYDFLEAEFTHDGNWAVARLKDLVRTGQLSPADSQILIACHLEGATLEEMAAQLGLSYQAMKKRRQRAAGHLKIIAPDLSPDLPDTPLIPLRPAPRREKTDDGDL